jgi:hypothetical protein
MALLAAAAIVFGIGPGEAARQGRGREQGGEDGSVHGREPFRTGALNVAGPPGEGNAPRATSIRAQTLGV